MNLPPLRLKKNQDRRIRTGHCWVYSNEVDTSVTPIKGFEPGQPVDLFDSRNKWLGSGYVNPHSLICMRIVSRDRAHPMSKSLLVHRLKVALALREKIYPTPHYRLVFGESDGLPGLVVDRYGEYLVVQLTTAGMERMKAEVLSALEKVIRPAALLWRNDTGSRELEGLDGYREPVGEFPAQLAIEENGCRYEVDALDGQKTGWFYDQAFNRARLGVYVSGARVLDLFSYVGAWGVQAAAAGANEVICVDASQTALEAVEHNARLNRLDQSISVLRGDAFEVMRGLRAERERFDVVLVDPPAFIKRRKDRKQGEQAYRRINQLGLQLLSRDGIMVSSSCSHHLATQDLMQLTQQAARETDRSLQLLEQGFQAPDHPIHPAMPETAYLKTLYYRSLPTF